MDKKNTILGIICIVAGIGYMYLQTKELSEQQRQQRLEAPADSGMSAPSDAVVAAPNTAATEEGVLGLLAQSVDAPSVVLKQPVAAVEEEIVRLFNDFVEVEVEINSVNIDDN